MKGHNSETFEPFLKGYKNVEVNGVEYEKKITFPDFSQKTEKPLFGEVLSTSVIKINFSSINSSQSLFTFNSSPKLEPQKGVPHCGSPVGPAGIPRERKGVRLKILSAVRDGRCPPKSPNFKTYCHKTDFI